MNKLFLVLLALAISAPSFAVEVCIVSKDVVHTNSYGRDGYAYYAAAECTEKGLDHVTGTNKQSGELAKAKLIKMLIEQGYHAKTDLMFVKP